MAVLAGGSSGALWAWNQAEENSADRVMGLQAQVGRPETWVASEGIFLRSRVGSEITELDYALTALDDGVTNGTNTLTSAAGPFEPSMVGLQMSIVGFGQRFITSFTSANEIEFSGNPIAAGSGRRFTLPLGRAQFTDGELSGTSLISASAPFNPSHVGTNANVDGLGTREIVAYISPTEVTLEGTAPPAQTGARFTVVTDLEPREVSLSSGGQVVDSHRTPRTNAATTIRWRVGDILRPRGRPREIFVPGIFIGAYPNFTAIEVGTAITPFTPFTNGSAFAVVAGSLPDGVTLNPATGEISGTPTTLGLLGGSPVGEYTGIVVQADGVANSPPFSFTVVGTALPVPDLYAPMDVNGLDGTLLAGFPVNTNVTFPGGGNGVVANAGSWAAGDSALNYGDNAAFRLNGNTALTVATNVNPTSHPAYNVRLAQHFNTDGWILGLIATTGELFWDARRATTNEDQRTTAAIPTGSWSHVAVSWQDSNLRADLFVDGLIAPLTTDVTGSGAVNDDTGDDLILGNQPLGTEPANGLQDEFALWTQVLSANQHATLAWLAQKGDSIGEWVRGLAPNAPAYSSVGPFVIDSPITTISPDTPSVDPEALAVTYFAYDPLPDGLVINPSNGEITGTPTATALLGGVDGVYTLRVGVTDGLNVAVSAPFDIAVEGVAIPVPDFYAPLDVNGFDGTGLIGFPTNVNVTFPGANGAVDGGADFGAVDSKLNYGDNFSFRAFGNTELTVSAVVKPDSFPNTAPRIAQHRNAGDTAGWIFSVDNVGVPQVIVRYGTTSAQATATNGIPTGSFSQLSFTWAADRSDIYIDGIAEVLTTDVTGTGGVNNDTGEDLLVGNDNGNVRAWDGVQDEFAIWTQALTASQHATLAWLAGKGTSLGEWIRGAPPSQASYSDYGPLAIGSAIPTISPGTGSVDPEAIPVTYLEYDPLPDGLSINPGTGAITGVPTATALLTGVNGLHSIRVATTDGMNLAVTAAFDIEFEGVALPDPVFYSPMELDYALGTIFAGDGRQGSINGSPTQVAGVTGLAHNNVSANNDWLAWPDDAALDVGTSDYTMVGCVKIGAGGVANIIVKRDAFQLFNPGINLFATETSVGFVHCDGSGNRIVGSHVVPSLDDSNFHSLVAAADRSGNAEVFLNGVSQGTTDISTQALSVDSPADLQVMGTTINGVQSTASDGVVDEVALFTSLFSANQAATVAWLKNKGQSLANWIKGGAPNAPIYLNQGPFDVGSPLSFAPSTPSIDPEAGLVTYIEYDPLPAGLSLNPTTGQVTGTPVAPSVANYRIAATDGMNLVVSPSFEINISVLTDSLVTEALDTLVTEGSDQLVTEN